MQIIGIAGPARSGKDSFAKELNLNCPRSKIVRFVDPVYKATYEFIYMMSSLGLHKRRAEYLALLLSTCIFNLDEDIKAKHREAFKTTTFKLGSRELTGRDLLVEVGTKLGREGILGDLAAEYGLVEKENKKDIWLNLLGEEIVELDKQDVSHVLIPDTRFLNEVKWIKEKGGFLVYLDSENADKNLGPAAEKELEEVKKLADSIIKVPKIQDEELRNYYFFIQAKQFMEELAD